MIKKQKNLKILKILKSSHKQEIVILMGFYDFGALLFTEHFVGCEVML